MLTLIYRRHKGAHEVVGALFGVSADPSENPFQEVVRVLREGGPAGRGEAEKHWRKGEPRWQPEEPDRVLIDSFDPESFRGSPEPPQRQRYAGKQKRIPCKPRG